MYSILLPLLSVLFTAVAVTAADLPSAKITTSLPAHQGHRTANMVDGDINTYFWTPRSVKKDETITFLFSSPVPKGKTVTIRTGKPEGGDRFDGAALEGSLDGSKWVVLSDGKAGLLTAKLTRSIKHFRLRATRDVRHWVAVREIEVSDKPPVKIVKGHATYKGKRIPLTIAGHFAGLDDLEPRFDEISQLYFKVWPELVTMLGSPVKETHRDVILKFKDNMGHPAHAIGNTIVISANHLRRNPSDAKGVFIHELTHVIQRYRGPGWFVEGVADYTRYKLRNNDNWAKWCRRRINYNKPFGAYWQSTAFLMYLEETHKKPIVRIVSMEMRAKTYKEEIWKKLTGKTLEELAKDYKNSGWKPAEPK